MAGGSTQLGPLPLSFATDLGGSSSDSVQLSRSDYATQQGGSSSGLAHFPPIESGYASYMAGPNIQTVPGENGSRSNMEGNTFPAHQRPVKQPQQQQHQEHHLYQQLLQRHNEDQHQQRVELERQQQFQRYLLQQQQQERHNQPQQQASARIGHLNAPSTIHPLGFNQNAVPQGQLHGGSLSQSVSNHGRRISTAQLHQREIRRFLPYHRGPSNLTSLDRHHFAQNSNLPALQNGDLMALRNGLHQRQVGSFDQRLAGHKMGGGHSQQLQQLVGDVGEGSGQGGRAEADAAHQLQPQLLAGL
jgi:hypothetical protein